MSLKILREISKIEMQRGKKKTKFSKWGTVAKGVEYTKWNYQRKERKDKKKYI